MVVLVASYKPKISAIRMASLNLATGPVRSASRLLRRLRHLVRPAARTAADPGQAEPLEGIEARLRLPNRGQRKALHEAALHAEMTQKHSAEVRQALVATAQGFAGRTEIDLEELRRLLASNLELRLPLRESVEEAIGLGGSTIQDPQLFFEAMALWLVDQQLGDGLLWRPAIEVRRA